MFLKELKHKIVQSGLTLGKFGLILTFGVFGCSKAELPLTPDVQTTLQVIAVNEEGLRVDSAQVFLDGSLIGMTPFNSQSIQSGLHALRVTQTGYRVYADQVVILDGQSNTFEALLEALPPNQGQLVVTTNIEPDRVQVIDINQTVIAETNERASTHMLLPGLYTVKGQKQGCSEIVAEVEIQSGATETIYLEFATPTIPPALEFDVEQDSVEFGDPVFIHWQTDGFQVVVDQGVGTRGPSGTDEINFVNPGKKVFTATAYGDGNLFTTKKDSVYVKEAEMPPLPVIMLSTTRQVTLNNPAAIRWQSQNAEYIVVDYVSNATLNGEMEVTFSTPGIRIVTATAFNQSGYVSASDTIEVVEPQVDVVDDILVSAESSVRADKGETGMVDLAAGTFEVERAGDYQLYAEVWYNSGDSQKNESYYIDIAGASGAQAPQNPNAGIYFVVKDDPGEPHTLTQTSGVFRLSEGEHSINIYHYAKISAMYPQFLNGEIDGPESVKILGFRLVYISD